MKRLALLLFAVHMVRSFQTVDVDANAKNCGVVRIALFALRLASMEVLSARRAALVSVL